MPRQIRCRCGQKIQIRKSEWVYVVAGIGIVGLLLNAVVIIYLYSRLGEVESHLALSNRAQPPQFPAAGENPSAPSAPDLAKAPEAIQEEENSTSRKTTPGPTKKNEVPPARKEPLETPTTTIAKAPATGGLVEKPLGSSLEQKELWKEFFRAIEDRFKPPASEGGDNRKVPGEIAPRTVIEAPALARLLFLSRGSTLPVLTAGHLLDPDPRIHNYAIQLLLDQPKPGLTESNTIRTLICAAAKTILKNDRGVELLGRFQLDEKAALLPEAKTEFDECWSTVITLAEGSRPGWPDLDTFAELLGGLERGGLDLVLAVDTTRSMEAGLRDLKKACSWLLPSLQWGASGVRVGFLTYKDKVVETHGLSETPGEDLLPHLLELKALGGGDVPEGVDSALRAALELGRFSWRPSAAKRIVVIGDAPANYSELPAIESLVSSCHEQDGFIVHMIGVHPKEGSRVPFFDRIAARGGGRSPTCPTGDLGKELLLGSLRAEDTALPKDLAGLLRRAFSELP
ncbi:MAG TPA: hypothetical protein DD471_10125 [Planctomycetes bacterium]|jgi:hypothetical protein|nr:hypothetical protein [Planctomycetota bacterium]